MLDFYDIYQRLIQDEALREALYAHKYTLWEVPRMEGS